MSKISSKAGKGILSRGNGIDKNTVVRERETQTLKQAPGSELSAQSPTRGSNSWTERS